MKIRHPEKQNRPINPIKKKPEWIRSKLTNSREFFQTKTIINNNPNLSLLAIINEFQSKGVGKIFIEKVLDEYDFTGVQLGTFADVFSNDENGRIFALWLSTDRRAAISLQKETSRNMGKRLSLVVSGQAIAVHPIEKTITNGYIPFLFVNKIPEEQVMVIYNKFSYFCFCCVRSAIC